MVGGTFHSVANVSYSLLANKHLLEHPEQTLWSLFFAIKWTFVLFSILVKAGEKFLLSQWERVVAKSIAISNYRCKLTLTFSINPFG